MLTLVEAGPEPIPGDRGRRFRPDSTTFLRAWVVYE